MKTMNKIYCEILMYFSTMKIDVHIIILFHSTMKKNSVNNVISNTSSPAVIIVQVLIIILHIHINKALTNSTTQCLINLTAFSFEQ